MIAEYLYALTPRDDQVTPIQAVNEFAVRSSAASNIDLEFQIPRANGFILKHVLLSGTGGGTQTVSIVAISILSEDGGTTVARLDVAFGLVLASVSRIYQFNDLLMLPGQRIRCAIAYSGAVSLNQAEFSISGILIPRGNLTESDLAQTL